MKKLSQQIADRIRGIFRFDGIDTAACHHCEHACIMPPAEGWHCNEPRARSGGLAVPVEIARKRGGACGPEAHLMTIREKRQ